MRPRQQTLGLVDVHALDHLILEPLSAAVESFDQFARPLNFRIARRERKVTRLDG